MSEILQSRLAERRLVLTKHYADPLELLEDREEAIFAGTPYSYKFAPDSFAIDAPPEVSIINESEMSAEVLFAKGSNRDRMGDRVNIPGVQDAHHRKNPITFLNHGKHFYLPIGKTESPNGEYTVRLSGDTGRAKIFYSQSLKEAEQVFRLRCEGIMRAGSIGYRPIRAFILPPDPVKNLPSGLDLVVTELLEVSDVGLPCNPETSEKITACLSMDKICGKSIHPAIKQVLAPLALPKRSWAHGFSYEPQGKAMPDFKKKDEKKETKEEPKGKPKEKETPKEEHEHDRGTKLATSPDTEKPQSPMNAPNVSTTTAKAQETIPNNPSPKSGSKPKHYGLQLLERLHEDLDMLGQDYTEMGDMLEPDSQVRPHMQKFLSDVEKWKQSTKETHSKTYPDADPLSDSEPEGTAAADMEREMANEDTGAQDYDPRVKNYQGEGKAATASAVGGPRTEPKHKNVHQPLNTGPGTAEEGKTGVNHPHHESLDQAVEFLSKLADPHTLFSNDHRILAKHHANALFEARKSLLGPEAAHQKDSIPTKPEAGAKPNTDGDGKPMEMGGKGYDPQVEAELEAELALEQAALEETNKMLASIS